MFALLSAAFFVNIPDKSLSLPSMSDSLASFQGMASIPRSLCMDIELGSDEDDLKFVFVIQSVRTGDFFTPKLTTRRQAQ